MWDEAEERRAQRHYTLAGGTMGPRPKYLLSGLLRCGECAASYVVTMKHAKQHVYGCAGYKERGAAVCANGRTVRRDIIEHVALNYVFKDLFAPHRIAYLSVAVDDAYTRVTSQPDTLTQERERALTQTRAELANIADAIRRGIITPTTKAMLEEAEQRVLSLEAALAVAKRKPSPIEPLAMSVERYLRDLRSTVSVNPEKARRLLAKGLERIVLQREDGHLVAYFHGTLAGVLRINDNAGSGTPTDQAGAGRPLWALSPPANLVRVGPGRLTVA